MSGAAELNDGVAKLKAQAEALDKAVRSDAILMSVARALLRTAAAMSGIPAGAEVSDVAFAAVKAALKS